jgi:hypothetical protein
MASPDGNPPQQADISAIEPSDAEIEQWATRERRRREAWLRGPTETEKAIWAQHERDRRAIEAKPRQFRRNVVDLRWFMRELQLATEGAINLLFRISIREALDGLVQAGVDWEESLNAPPSK